MLTMSTTIGVIQSDVQKKQEITARGHVYLFISDVTSSSVCFTDKFKTKKGLNYQRVRLNGILVSQSNEKLDIWLDDGTDTIRVVLSPRLLARMDAPKLTLSASVTVFGLVKHLDNEFVVQCGGFQVEDDASNDLYHTIKVLSNQPLSSTIDNKANSKVNNENIDNNNKKKISYSQRKPTALFNSLSSQPSPPTSHPFSLNILSTPEQQNRIQQEVPTTPITAASQFIWSPELPIATSTPLASANSTPLTMKQLISLRESPLRSIQNNMRSLIDNDDDDDDCFDSLNISFTRIEQGAISKPQKRRWEP